MDKELRERSIKVINEKEMLSSLFKNEKKENNKDIDYFYRLYCHEQQEKTDKNLKRKASRLALYYGLSGYFDVIQRMGWLVGHLKGIASNIELALKKNISKDSATTMLAHYYMCQSINSLSAYPFINYYLCDIDYIFRNRNNLVETLKKTYGQKEYDKICSKALSRGVHAARMALEADSRCLSVSTNDFKKHRSFDRSSQYKLIEDIKKRVDSDDPHTPVVKADLDFLLSSIERDSKGIGGVREKLINDLATEKDRLLKAKIDLAKGMCSKSTGKNKERSYINLAM